METFASQMFFMRKNDYFSENCRTNMWDKIIKHSIFGYNAKYTGTAFIFPELVIAWLSYLFLLRSLFQRHRMFFRKHHDGTQFSTGSFIEAVNTWIISIAKTAAGLEQVKTGEMMFLLGDSVPAVVEVRAPSKIYHSGPTLKKKKRSPATFSEECLNHLICSKGSWTSHLIPNFLQCRRHEIYRIKKINTSSQNSHLSNSKAKVSLFVSWGELKAVIWGLTRCNNFTQKKWFSSNINHWRQARVTFSSLLILYLSFISTGRWSEFLLRSTRHIQHCLLGWTSLSLTFVI